MINWPRPDNSLPIVTKMIGVSSRANNEQGTSNIEKNQLHHSSFLGQKMNKEHRMSNVERDQLHHSSFPVRPTHPGTCSIFNILQNREDRSATQ